MCFTTSMCYIVVFQLHDELHRLALLEHRGRNRKCSGEPPRASDMRRRASTAMRSEMVLVLTDNHLGAKVQANDMVNM